MNERDCMIRGGPYDGTYQRIDVSLDFVWLYDPLPALSVLSFEKGYSDQEAAKQLYERVEYRSGLHRTWYEYHLIKPKNTPLTPSTDKE